MVRLMDLTIDLLLRINLVYRGKVNKFMEMAPLRSYLV